MTQTHEIVCVTQVLNRDALQSLKTWDALGVDNSPRPRGEIWATITALEAPSVFLARVESNKLRPVDRRQNERSQFSESPVRGGQREAVADSIAWFAKNHTRSRATLGQAGSI
jgi:hypothetical protein